MYGVLSRRLPRIFLRRQNGQNVGWHIAPAGFGRGQSSGARYTRSSCKPVTFRRRDRRNIQPTRAMVMRALGFTLRVKNTTAGPPFLLLLVSFAKCLPIVGIISAAARSEVNGR